MSSRSRLVVDHVSATGRSHDHDWVLQAVSHEDGSVVEEYRCSKCGELTFR